MSTAKYEVKRARVYLRKSTSNVFRDINTVDAASYAFQEDKITKQSTNEVIGDVAKKVIKTSGTLTLTMGSTEWENFCIAVRARVSTQAAVTAGAFTYPVLAAGEMFKLPHVNITAATIAGKVEGVDFKIMKNSGFITALTDNLAIIEGGTYAAGLARRGAIAAGTADEYEVIVDDILNSESNGFYRWSPNLPSNVALISANEFGVYEVTGDLLLDESKASDGEYGQFGVKHEILAEAV